MSAQTPASLLGPGGPLILTLRPGGDEVERLARGHGLAIVRRHDGSGRPEGRWTGIALRLPEDGTGDLRTTALASFRTTALASFRTTALASFRCCGRCAASPTARRAKPASTRHDRPRQASLAAAAASLNTNGRQASRRPAVTGVTRCISEHENTTAPPAPGR